MKLEDVPKELRPDIVEMRTTGHLAAVKADADMGSGLLGQINRDNAQERNVEQFMAKTGTSAPALVHNLVPSAPSM